MAKIYGFARCSLAEERGQDINRQVRELKSAGAEEIVLEREHGDAKVKKNLDMLLQTAEASMGSLRGEVPQAGVWGRQSPTFQARSAISAGRRGAAGDNSGRAQAA